MVLIFSLFIMEFDFRDLVMIIYLFCTLDPRRVFLLRCQHEIWEKVGTQLLIGEAYFSFVNGRYHI